MKLLYISLGNGGLVSINVGHIPRDKFQKDAYTFVSMLEVVTSPPVTIVLKRWDPAEKMIKLLDNNTRKIIRIY